MPKKLKLPIEIVKLSGELQEDGYPFEAIILSGEPIEGVRRADGTIRERFIVDFTTLRHHPRVIVNYNHNEELIIGYGENFQVTPDGLKSTGIIAAGDEFRAHLVNLSKNGVPFEASTEIDLDAATETIIGDNEQVTVNGRNYFGPLAVYSNVPLKAYAMCPHGADKFTKFTLLTEEKNYLMKKRTNTPMTKLSDEEKNAPDPAEEVKAAVKSQELADLMDIFGTENGAKLYQDGTDVAEVKQWQALNEKYAQYLSASGDDDDPPADPPEGEGKEDTPPADDPPKDDGEEDKLSAKILTQLKAMDKKLETQSAEIVKLKASMPPKGADPVSHNGATPSADPKPTTSIKAYAAAKCNTIVETE